DQRAADERNGAARLRMNGARKPCELRKPVARGYRNETRVSRVEPLPHGLEREPATSGRCVGSEASFGIEPDGFLSPHDAIDGVAIEDLAAAVDSHRVSSTLLHSDDIRRSARHDCHPRRPAVGKPPTYQRE